MRHSFSLAGRRAQHTSCSGFVVSFAKKKQNKQMENGLRQLEELEVLLAILCEDGELELPRHDMLLLKQALSDNSDLTKLPLLQLHVHLKLATTTAAAKPAKPATERKIPDSDYITITITLPRDYPLSALPEFSVHSKTATFEQTQLIHDAIQSGLMVGMGVSGECVIMDMVMLAQDSLNNNNNNASETPPDGSDDPAPDAVLPTIPHDCNEHTISALIHIDHMRDRTLYCKTIGKWALELAISCCVLRISSRWNILLCLQGSTESVNEFTTRLRTQCVDVDSKGRRCKERMSRELLRTPAKFHPLKIIVGLSETEVATIHDAIGQLEQFGFRAIDLNGMFDQ
jgi:hypothetical protein